MKTKVAMVLLALMAFVSCEEEANLYDVENGQTLVSFEISSVNLGVPEEGASIDIVVSVSTGSENDRDITLEIDPSSTATSDQYELSNSGIPAGTYRGVITISGKFENLPDEGSTSLLLNLINVSEAKDLTLSNGTLSVSLFRECPPEPTPGVWTITMEDSYGDGWQTSSPGGGPGLTCTLSTGEVFEFGLCSPYEAPSFDCTPDFSSGTATFIMPEGVESAEWFFPGDFYGEISFSIIAPNGNVVAQYGPGSIAGPVIIDFCAQ